MRARPALDSYHLNIRIYPEGDDAKKLQEEYPHLWYEKEESGREYFTLGAAMNLKNGKLESTLNRKDDLNSTGIVHFFSATDYKCDDEYSFIKALIDADAQYANNAPYSFPFFPWPEDGYNSNSYVTGLLQYAGQTGSEKLPRIGKRGI